jgi:hypothetical protein
MTDSAALERSYRRVLACYPRSFRKGNEDEILAVLMDTAEEGQTRIGLPEAADLIRGAVRMRLWPADTTRHCPFGKIGVLDISERSMVHVTGLPSAPTPGASRGAAAERGQRTMRKASVGEQPR